MNSTLAIDNSRALGALQTSKIYDSGALGLLFDDSRALGALQTSKIDDSRALGASKIDGELPSLAACHHLQPAVRLAFADVAACSEICATCLPGVGWRSSH